MKSSIVSDGEDRVRDAQEFRSQMVKLRETIRARYATQLAEAGFFRRLILHWRIASEIRRERQRIEPSRHSLYSSRIARE